MRHHASIIFTHSKWKINVRCWALGLQVAWELCSIDLQNLSLSFADDLYQKPALGEGHVVLQTLNSQSSKWKICAARLRCSSMKGFWDTIVKHVAATPNRFKLRRGNGQVNLPVWRLCGNPIHVIERCGKSGVDVMWWSVCRWSKFGEIACYELVVVAPSGVG